MKRMLYAGCLLLSVMVMAQTALPPANKKVVEYVKGQVGKTVGRGECWDLAKEALNYAGAKWDGSYGFGRKLDIKTESLLPGDIVQFTGVKMEHREGNSLRRWTMEKHTTVIYEVKSPDVVVMAEQNMGNVRKVALNEYRLSEVVKGTIAFYRPKL